MTADPATLIAFHESGHAVALLHFGIPVRRLFASAGGGECQAAFQPTSPLQGATVALAGGVGEEVAGGGEAAPSGGDIEAILREAAGLPVQDRNGRRWLRRQAEAVIRAHLPALHFLAGELAARGELRADDLGAICSRPNSPLSPFRRLYAKPVTARPAAGRPRAALTQRDEGRWVKVPAPGVLEQVRDRLVERDRRRHGRLITVEPLRRGIF
jgi:hypothetical protein